MTRASIEELLDSIRPRYRQGSRAVKSRILDEFVAITGYHRKHAIRLFGNGHRPAGSGGRGRPKIYGPEVRRALLHVWEILERPCSHRLHPFLAEFVAVLTHHGHFPFPEQTKKLLLQIGRGSIDRLLSSARNLHGQYPRWRTTKPGSLLKEAIPVRTFADWNDARPGFCEIDLVYHCGESVRGRHLYTLNAVDVATGWSEPIALPRRSRRAVCDAINQLRRRLPFPLLGIDSDNDSAFINEDLFHYCSRTHITFTRCRPYKKNDQAHVEQKNWSVVRRLIGYDRYESPQALALIQAIYHDWRLYSNFFQPVMKLIHKTRAGSKVRKRYDEARTPYQRVLASPQVDEQYKEPLRQLYATLDPVALRERIHQNQDALWNLAR